jgi:cytochrome c peroxidase
MNTVNTRLTYLMLALMLVTIHSCKKEGSNNEVGFYQPSNFPPPKYSFATNPVTKEGFELGRALFYETKLSRDNTISCGSCHQQFAAFVHAGHTVSHGIDDLLGTRNSPPIMNLAWNEHFFWDGGVHNLDLFTPSPIENPVEMDEKFVNVLNKIRNDSRYPPMFKAAFGTEEVSSVRFMQAMSQFMVCLISSDSKYDKYVRNEGATLTSEEISGMQLFKTYCSSCHKMDLFTDDSFHNNGLYYSYNDSGRYRITLRPEDIAKFKTPSLRNIEKTAPYMHDGSLKTLEAVLKHYATGVKPYPTLDPLLINENGTGIPLSIDEQKQIIAFLKTLTDQKFLTDKRFAEF